MNKITSMIIEGRMYSTITMSAQALSEFVMDINKENNLQATCHKYNILEVN